MYLNKEQLWQLRNQISLNSLYYADFKNQFGVEIHACSAFFDGFLDFIEDEMKEDIEGFTDDKFFDYLDMYDNADYLWDWYMCHDYDCFPIDKDWVNSELKSDAEDNLIDLVYNGEWCNKKPNAQYYDLLDCIMNVVNKFEERYPELKKEGDDDLKWYDKTREELMAYYEDYVG